MAVPSGMLGEASSFLQDTIKNWYREADPTDTGDQTILLRTIGLEFLERLRELSHDDHGAQQWLLFTRNIGQVTPKIVYFHYPLHKHSRSKYQTNVLFNFETKSTGVQPLNLSFDIKQSALTML